MDYSSRDLRNGIILKLSLAKVSQKQISEAVNLTVGMVSRVLSKFRTSSVSTEKRSGAIRRLSDEALNLLPSFLRKGAESYDFTGDYWTHKRVKYVINKEFGIDYSEKQVGRLLDLIGWTRQKPQKKDAKQDLGKVENWKKEELPALKKSVRGRL